MDAGEPAAEAVPEGEQQQAQRQKHSKREKPPPPSRPTHFLALQVSQHEGVRDAIATVQSSLRQHSPHLQGACVDAASAHLTLGVMALGSPEERQRAEGVLAALAEPLAQAALLAPLEVELAGLSTFRDQVLYLDVMPGEGLERLMALAGAARAHFQAAGLLLQADQAFTPHVTIAKTSKLLGYGGRAGGRHGHGRSHGRGRRDWRAKSEEQRRATQQRLQLQPEDAEVAAAASAAKQPRSSTCAEAPATGDGQCDSERPQPEAGASQGSAAAQQQGEQPPSGNWRAIDAQAWRQHEAIAGGRVALTEVQLCAMQGRLPGDYYRVAASLLLAPAAADVKSPSAAAADTDSALTAADAQMAQQ